jgi:hypothetical protein
MQHGVEVEHLRCFVFGGRHYDGTLLPFTATLVQLCNCHLRTSNCSLLLGTYYASELLFAIV